MIISRAFRPASCSPQTMSKRAAMRENAWVKAGAEAVPAGARNTVRMKKRSVMGSP